MLFRKTKSKDPEVIQKPTWNGQLKCFHNNKHL